MPDNKVDPMMAKTFDECLEDIQRWDYYDVSRSATNRLRSANGEIKVNWSVDGDNGHNDARQISCKKDITQNRIAYLQTLTQLFKCSVELWTEYNPGKVREKPWRIYKNGIATEDGDL